MRIEEINNSTYFVFQHQGTHRMILVEKISAYYLLESVTSSVDFIVCDSKGNQILSASCSYQDGFPVFAIEESSLGRYPVGKVLRSFAAKNFQEDYEITCSSSAIAATRMFAMAQSWLPYIDYVNETVRTEDKDAKKKKKKNATDEAEAAQVTKSKQFQSNLGSELDFLHSVNQFDHKAMYMNITDLI